MPKSSIESQSSLGTVALKSNTWFVSLKIDLQAPSQPRVPSWATADRAWLRFSFFQRAVPGRPRSLPALHEHGVQTWD